MNSQEIEEILMLDKDVRRIFRGIYAVDELKPDVILRNRLYVCNADLSVNPGLHWICIYIPEKSEQCVEMFDSLGKNPQIYPQNISNFLIYSGKSYMYNTLRIQDFFSESCGLFCIMYCICRSKGISFRDILHYFTPSLSNNEHLVVNFIKEFLRNIEDRHNLIGF